jgi:hypothetical protein
LSWFQHTRIAVHSVLVCPSVVLNPKLLSQ